MIVLISGAIATGKTATATELAEITQGLHIRVREALAEILGIDMRDRKALQQGGAELDHRTSGLWLRDYLAKLSIPGRTIVVDSLRTIPQTESILSFFDSCRLVHLCAHESTRRRRYGSADDLVKKTLSFDDAVSHPTEQRADDLIALASVVVETDEIGSREVARLIANQLGLPTRS